MLHIVDGGSVAGTLREAAVAGEIRIYGDLKYEGPAPAGLDPQSWCNIRAQFLSDKLGLAREDALAFLQASFLTLDAASKHEEIVLWLDHRLSDQLILIELLDWFSRSKREGSQLSLICVGQYPGISNFVGLGQLTPDQLTSWEAQLGMPSPRPIQKPSSVFSSRTRLRCLSSLPPCAVTYSNFLPLTTACRGPNNNVSPCCASRAHFLQSSYSLQCSRWRIPYLWAIFRSSESSMRWPPFIIH
jgi:hypothetical protein